ncbi:MAG: 2,3-bisphosphoglycerate-independent phosphoglycerate mutase [Clostridia bacterium]|nr:2,3-bisphosphoglycerate-independent phosphoglycerate mutase [Clostridia bacterium]
MKNFKRPTMLMILDGFGCSKKTEGNAIAAAKTPNLDSIFAKYPHTQLGCCGLSVGLPEGQMGNSEVGHLNIGAGRIVYQELTKITKKIEDKSFFSNRAFCDAAAHLKKTGGCLHLFGLLSDGGVHSHISHLEALLGFASENEISKVYVHCFLDGRDVPPRCAMKYISQLEDFMKKLGTGKIATVSGRYYAMDRDKRWDRIQKAYDALTLGKGRIAPDAAAAIDMAYNADENDEFVIPTVISSDSEVLSNGSDEAVAKDACVVNNGDAIIMYNFRPDRAREITRAFVDADFNGFKREKVIRDLKYVCMTQYDAEMPAVEIAYPPEKMQNTFGEYISKLGLRQLRIAETEKYAHVTFFFNGGVEEPNKNEDRILIPSPKVATYDLQPEMSAYLVKDAVLEQIASDKYDVIILNFANADMVGHTGIMSAAVSAVEALDSCVEEIKNAVLEKGGRILLTADHGNADCMIDENGNTVTAHSLNPVPLVHIAENPCELKDGGILADLIPTMLDLMGIDIPPEMTGRSLKK